MKLLACALALAALAGCGQTHAPPLGLLGEVDATPADVSDDASAFDISTAPPVIDCSGGKDAGYCGCTEIAQKTPLIYLVLDKSGSMSQPFGTGSSVPKWTIVRQALFDLSTGTIRKLGGRVTVGAATFPGDSTSCLPGNEVFAPTRGSHATYDAVAGLLAAIAPGGGTPTAATLANVRARISGLGMKAYVLLATDGGPNCAHTPCTAASCGDNIDGLKYGTQPCDSTFNCCDPSLVPTPVGSEWTSCVDQTGTVGAIANLASDGVPTYVVGVPGSEAYGAVLDAMAVAGGTARSGASAKYYAAADPTELTTALSSIAASVVTSCTITLTAPPTDPGVTNVLVDGDIIPQDATDGWTWSPDHTSVILHGASCDRVTAGVGAIQVATGCKTVTR